MTGTLNFISEDPTDTTDAQAPIQGSVWYWRAEWIFNATGYVAKMMWRKKYKSTTPALTITESNGLSWPDRGGVDPATAILQCKVLADVLAAIPYGDYYYDLELTPGVDTTLTEKLFRGKVKLLPEVTYP